MKMRGRVSFPIRAGSRPPERPQHCPGQESALQFAQNPLVSNRFRGPRSIARNTCGRRIRRDIACRACGCRDRRDVAFSARRGHHDLFCYGTAARGQNGASQDSQPPAPLSTASEQWCDCRLASAILQAGFAERISYGYQDQCARRLLRTSGSVCADSEARRSVLVRGTSSLGTVWKWVTCCARRPASRGEYLVTLAPGLTAFLSGEKMPRFSRART